LKKAVGIDIGGTNTRISFITEKGHVLKQAIFKTPNSKSPEKTIYEIFLKVKNLKILSPSIPVGLAVPALVDPQSGIVELAPNLNWRNFNLKKTVLKKFKLKKIVFENDANCAAWAIYKKQKDKIKNLCVVTLGTGVGGGYIHNGKLLQKQGTSIFEIGHIKIDPDGPKCGCGGRGCLETFCGARHMNKWAKKFWKKTSFKNKNLTPLEIEIQARRGKIWARKVWQEYGKYLGLGLSNVINLLAPQKIALTGGISAAYPLFKKDLIKSIFENALPQYTQNLKIEKIKWNRFTGSIGAGLLALH